MLRLAWRGLGGESDGMSWCRLHHAAFDQLLLGVHPDCVIHVRPDIFYEIDGPMFRHGFQGLQGQRIVVPSLRLEVRWERFWERGVTLRFGPSGIETR